MKTPYAPDHIIRSQLILRHKVQLLVANISFMVSVGGIQSGDCMWPQKPFDCWDSHFTTVGMPLQHFIQI